MKTVVALHTSCALLQRVIDLWAKYEIPAKLVNIIDDSLIWEVIDNDGATLSVKRRMRRYAESANELNADYVFNTCSSVGKVFDEMEPFSNVPIIKIDTPMAENAVKAIESKGTIGVIATLPTTLPPTVSLVEKAVKESGKDIEIKQFVAEGAFQILMNGDRDTHNKIIIEKAKEIADQFDTLVLAQGSMALLEQDIADAIGKQVFSSPESGVAQFLEILK